MRRLLLAFGLTLLVCGAARGEIIPSYVTTITLQDGVSPAADSDFCRDSYINSSPADSAKNHGAADTLRVSGPGWAGTFKSGINSILMSWDVAGALSDSAVITEATLFLYQNLGGSGSSIIDSLEIVALLPDWTEGTGTNAGTVEAASADWQDRNGTPWGAAGATLTVTDASYMRQWIASDSTSVAPTFAGDDTATVANSALVGKDITRFSSSIFVADTGTLGARQGWQGIDVLRYARQAQRGVRSRMNMKIQPHNTTTNTRVVGFASSENPYKVIRPKLVLRYVLVEAGSGGGSGTTGIPLGIGGTLGVGN